MPYSELLLNANSFMLMPKYCRTGSQAHMGTYSILLVAYSIKVETKNHLSVPLAWIQTQKTKPALKPLNLDNSRYSAAGQKSTSAATPKNIRQ